MWTRLVAIVSLSGALLSFASAEMYRVGDFGRTMLRGDASFFLSDGRILTAAYETLLVLDPDTGETLSRFAGRNVPTEVIRHVVLDPARDLVVLFVRSDDARVIEVWNTATQTLLQRWDAAPWIGDPSRFSLRAGALSPAEPLLAVAAEIGVSLWNWETGEYVRELAVAHPSAGYQAVAFSPDGKRLVTAARERPGEVWDVATGALLGVPPDLSGSGVAAAYGPDGRSFAVVLFPNRVFIFDSETLERRSAFASGSGRIDEVVFSRDGRLLYVPSEGYFSSCANGVDCSGVDDTVRIWDVETGTLLRTIADAPTSLSRIALSTDERLLLLESANVGALITYDLEQDTRRTLIADFGVHVEDAEVSGDGRTFIEMDRGLLRVWDLPTRTLRHVEFADRKRFFQTAIAPDSRSYAVGYGDRYEIRSIETNRSLSSIPARFAARAPIAFTPDGQTLVAYVGPFLRMVSLQPDGQTLDVLIKDVPPKPGGDVWTPYASDVVVSPDGRWILAWDFDNPTPVHLFRRRTEGDYSHAYSFWVDYQVIAASFKPPARAAGAGAPGNAVFALTGVRPEGHERIAEFWVATPKEALRLDVPEFPDFESAVFDESGHFLFVARVGKTEVWSWKERSLFRRTSVPRYSHVNEDGSALLTGGRGDGWVLWDLSPIVTPKPALWGAVKRTALLPNFPNPANPETWIPFTLAERADVRLTVHDLSGRVVRTLDLGSRAAGRYTTREDAAHWDGRNAAGETVGSGVYFVTLEAGSERDTRRIVLAR